MLTNRLCHSQLHYLSSPWALQSLHRTDCKVDSIFILMYNCFKLEIKQKTQEERRMNERIKELLVEAGVYECDVNDPEFVVPNELEKFAELIVQEMCNKVIQPYMSRGPEDHPLVTEVKEHFGVAK